MSSLFALRALLFSVECFLGSALILVTAWLAARGVCKTGSQRHLVWLVAFGALLVLPILAAIVPPHFIIAQTAAAPVMVPAQEFVPLQVAAMAPAAPALGYDTLARGLFALWLVGVGAAALRGALAALGLRALHRRSVPYFLEGVDASKLTVAGRNWKLRLLTQPGGSGPITWGFFRPIVLLPKAAVLWPRDQLEAVLLHEVAHVRRYDSLAQALSLLACALYWPNPLVWMCARLLRREAEVAADDAVLRSGVKPSAYAGLLVTLAAEFRQQRVSPVMLSMAAPSALEARVKSVLAPTQPRSGVTAMDALKIAGLGLLATSFLAFARPSFADTQDVTLPAIPAPVAAPAPLNDAAPVAIPAPAPPSSDIADATEPPDPPEPALPSEPDLSALPAPPTPPAVPAVPQRVVRIMKWQTPDSVRVIKLEGTQAEVDKAMAQARPEIEKAVADAKIAETVSRAMAKVQPEIDKAVAQAIANAKIEEAVARAIAKAQPEIDKAVAQAKKRAAAARRDHAAEPVQDRP